MAFKLSSEVEEFKSLINRFFKDTLSSDYLRSRSDSSKTADPVLRGKLSELGLAEFFADESFQTAYLYVLAYASGHYLLPEPELDRLLFGPLLHQLLSEKEKAELEQTFPGIQEKLLSGEVVTGSIIAARHTSLSSESEGKISGNIRLAAGVKNSGYLVTTFQKKPVLIELLETELQAEKALDATVKRFSISIEKKTFTYLPPELQQKLYLREAITRAAEICGACERVLKMAQEFVTERKQFGVPVGGFQALQHKIVDCYVFVQSLDALLRYSAWAIDEAPDQAELAVRTALWKATREGSPTIETLLQVHGGIGFTWEYDLHLFLRRVKTLEAIYGAGSEDRAALLLAASH